jgi:hypothetical protein
MAKLKVILSNRGALRKKYGDPFPELDEALGDLAEADAVDGIETKILYLDDETTMRAHGAEPVTVPDREKQNKTAVDAVVASLKPDYILLLGATDVIPHQRLENPFEAPSDPDYGVPSDLPYGCDGPYSGDITHFLTPKRVVGRLPDVRGRTGNRAYFLQVIRNSVAHRAPRPESVFRDCLAFCREDVAEYTRLIMETTFGSGEALQVVDQDANPHWSGEQMAKFVHYGNCHGMPFRPMFFGTGTDNVMMDLERLDAHPLSPGMVAAYEACYGAQLYDPKNPRVPADGTGICSTYLQKGCVAYFGSSNTSFGSKRITPGNSVSPTDLGNADLITQYFLKNLLSGCSTGQACLNARHDFVEEMTRRRTGMTPTALKTLAQFNLLGDPSITPVERRQAVPRELTFRRDRAEDRARVILNTCRASRHDPRAVLPPPIRDVVQAFLKEHVKEPAEMESSIRSYQLPGLVGAGASDGLQDSTHVHAVALNLTRQRGRKNLLHRIMVLEVLEDGGEVLDISAYESQGCR